MRKKKETVTISLPVLPIVAVFVVLKLTEVISWDWVWVLSPLWIPSVAVLGIIAFIATFALAGITLGAFFRFIERR